MFNLFILFLNNLLKFLFPILFLFQSLLCFKQIFETRVFFADSEHFSACLARAFGSWTVAFKVFLRPDKSCIFGVRPAFIGTLILNRILVSYQMLFCLSELANFLTSFALKLEPVIEKSLNHPLDLGMLELFPAIRTFVICS